MKFPDGGEGRGEVGSVAVQSMTGWASSLSSFSLAWVRADGAGFEGDDAQTLHSFD